MRRTSVRRRPGRQAQRSRSPIMQRWGLQVVSDSGENLLNAHGVHAIEVGTGSGGTATLSGALNRRDKDRARRVVRAPAQGLLNAKGRENSYYRR